MNFITHTHKHTHTCMHTHTHTHTHAQVKKNFLSNLTWGKSQTRAGTNDTFEPCAKPGCQPFPECCRTDDEVLPVPARPML